MQAFENHVAFANAHNEAARAGRQFSMIEFNAQGELIKPTYTVHDSPLHICTPESCPAGRYFVTAIDGTATHFMAGPYREHAAALVDVDKALKIADKHDARAWFMSWGTVRIVDDRWMPAKVGQLNKHNLI